MKACTVCGEVKALDEFNNRKRSTDGKASACKLCRRRYDNSRYADSDSRKDQIRRSNARRALENSKFVRNYLTNNPCVDCGEPDPELLEFDHVTGKKIAGVGRLVHQAMSLEKIKQEIAKCEVRCLHCHRKRTIASLGWYKVFSS
jgi:hypothetical protein